MAGRLGETVKLDPIVVARRIAVFISLVSEVHLNHFANTGELGELLLAEGYIAALPERAFNRGRKTSGNEYAHLVFCSTFAKLP